MAFTSVSNSTSKTLPAAPEPPKKRKNREWTGASIALLIGVAGLCFGRLGFLWIRFDIFSQFAMQFIFLALAAILGMALPRFKGLFAIVGFIILICLYGLLPHLLKDGAEGALQDGEKRLRVAQFNAHSINPNHTEIIAMVRALNPDVMTIVEFVPSSKPVLDGLKTDYPYQATCWEVAACSFAIISKTPLDNINGKGTWEGAPFLRASLGAEFGNLNVLAVHTTRFPFAVAQFKQVNALAKYLETVPGNLLVMGDFNATPFSRVIQNFTQSLGLTRQTQLPSWPSQFDLPQLAIDHIFTGPGIRALGQETIGDNAGSDHYPVAITLAVPAK